MFLKTAIVLAAVEKANWNLIAGPHGVVVHSNGRKFVAHTYIYHVQVLNSDLSFSHFRHTVVAMENNATH